MARLEERGPAALHAELAGRAPGAAEAVDPGDRTRIVRALELLEMGEEPAPVGDASRLWTADLRRPTVLCGLTMKRERLYERIDARVDAMLAAGAEAMKRRTRNYAKRQLTWMRRLEGANLLDAETDPAGRVVSLTLEEDS